MGASSASRKKLYNGLMAAAIVAIIAAAVLLVGSLQGWLNPSPAQGDSQSGVAPKLVAQDKTGYVNIERGGIVYALDNGNELRDKDIVETLKSSAVDFALDDNTIALNEKTKTTLELQDATVVGLDEGEAFVDMSAPDSSCAIRMDGDDVICEEGVFHFTSRANAKSIYVLAGNASVDGQTAAAGQVISVLTDAEGGKTVSVTALDPAMLSDFCLLRAKGASDRQTLALSVEDIDKVLGERQANTSAEATAAENSEMIEAGPDTGSDSGSESSSASGTSSGSPAGAAAATAQTKPVSTCTISINCHTILNNLGDLTPGKEIYVPANGVILAPSTVAFKEGETVFDVLKRVCDAAGIQLEYSFTPMYGSYYIEGINHLYEFDCGYQSGWMYMANGWYPNYGCSSYELKPGDVITWNYTCKDLGGDLGVTFMQ